MLVPLDEDIRNSETFQKAITHRSASNKNNERLEFLGDSVLNLVISTYLYEQLPDIDEGGLSRLRSYLVKGETLAKIAAENNLGDYLKLGAGELKSGGFRRHSIIEDAFEAIIGAVFLLRGFDYVQRYVLLLYTDYLDHLPSADSLKDPKSRLQEWLQSRGQSVPAYRVLDIAGEAHQQTFTAECWIEGMNIRTQAKGSSRRKAEQRSAEKAFGIVTAS
ncbi:MAG TPA: ribonuclease III [Gammaproteobacteria bacterium]|nr:ribonuclease III [Gammaproteobacteria bacterium]